MARFRTRRRRKLTPRQQKIQGKLQRAQLFAEILQQGIGYKLQRMWVGDLEEFEQVCELIDTQLRPAVSLADMLDKELWARRKANTEKTKKTVN
jgi:hypothetical protein